VVGFAGTGPGLQDALDELTATAAAIKAANAA